ncbi:MAG: hypothetical protein Kow0062_09030 [Acidobacteriota bacterium]
MTACHPVVAALALLCTIPASHGAADRLAGWFPDARFDPAVPRPDAVLGFAPGDRPATHAEVLQYFEALADASPRASLTRYARTHEGRDLVVLAIADPETVADLEGFRARHVALVDGADAMPDDGALRSARAVAWLAYAIHGDELSSTDAALAVAYRLVAGEDEFAWRIRRNLLVLIDPLQNPDGRDRYLAMIRSFAHLEPTGNLDDLSHTAVWPWGRGNHFLFDLNRDWFSQVQPESARSAVMARWLPQLVVDSHEMGPNSTYLFSPPRHPFNPHLPASNARWRDTFAADQARALDARGFPYYTREWNEEFFPGYGSSWSSYFGAVGILYEMSRTSGTRVLKRSGDLRTFPEAVEHQVTSSMANLGTLLEHRAELLHDFVAARREAIEAAGRGGTPAAWILPETRHPKRVRRLVRLLRHQGIVVLHRESAAGLGAPVDGRTGRPVAADRLRTPAWIVPLDQPTGRLARNLLDPHVPMSREFLHEEREYLERRRGSRLYETTAWSLPLAYGIDAWWTPRRVGDRRGADVPAADPPATAVPADGPAVAWLADGRDENAPRLLAALLRTGIRAAATDEPLAVAGREFARGSLVIPARGNPDDLPQRLAELAREHGVPVVATATFRAERGPDLGGSHVRPLVAPRIAVLAGAPVAPSAYGELWFLLDHELGYPFAAVDARRFAGLDLRRYDVLVVPPAMGGSKALAAALGPKAFERLARFVDGGGTLIGIGSGAELLAGKERKLTRTRLRREVLEEFPPVVLGPDALTAEAAGKPVATGLRAPAAGGEAAPAGPADDPWDVAPLIGPGARPFAGLDGWRGGPPVPLAEWIASTLPPGRDKPTAAELSAADERLRRFAPRGAFVRALLDPRAFLCFGLGETEVPVLLRTGRALVAGADADVAARLADPDALHLGGLLWPEAAGRLARTAWAVREARGRGQVILFSDEPEFRGWTLATRRLLVNALLYGPGLGTRWAGPTDARH